MQPRPQNTIEAPGKPGAALVAKLEKLRDRRRLGIHMWEDCMPYSFPSVSHETFDEWRAVPEMAKPPQTSISLLPTKEDGVTLQPYGCMPGTFNVAGYLLDLSEDQPTPPTILAAHTETMESGDGAYTKKYPQEYNDVTLDMLAERYVTQHKPLRSAPGAAQFNEVQAHIGHPHVAAIVIPTFDDMEYPLANYDALVTLAGCMSALEHARRGAALPLVSYHVTGTHKGEITYIGEGEQQLKTLAAQSLMTIMESESPRAFKLMVLDYGGDALMERLQSTLGLDLDKEPKEQRAAFAKLGVHVGGKGRG